MINKSKENKSTIKSKYRPEIDGFRAFAVVTVIINHFNQEILPKGYLGVDIFFVISGFVITSSLYQRPSKNFKDFISGFYERRIKRLIPALSVFILISSIAICLFNPEPQFSLRTGLSSLFGFSNLYLLKNSTDYFGEVEKFNMFTHTWSLGVEEQFYIIFPFLIWFSGFGRQTKYSSRNLFLIVGAFATTSLIGFFYLYPINQSAAYFLMPTRFWEMAVGCLTFITFQKRKSIEDFLENIPPILLLTLIIGVMYFPLLGGKEATFAIVFLSSIFIAALKKGTRIFAFFTNPKIIYIGLISYSLYLWHWSVLTISRWTIGIHWWSVPFQVTIIFCLAFVSYKYIEKPLRKVNWFGKRWKTLMVGVGVPVALSAGLVIIDKPLKGKLYTGVKKNKPTHDIRWRREIRLGGSSLTGKKCHSDSSYSEQQLKILFKECKYPLFRKSKDQSSVAFVGDSHTLSLLKAEKILSDFGLRIIHYSRNGCPFPLPPYGVRQDKCNNFMTNAETEIFQDLKSGDSIIINNYHLSHLGGENLKDTRHNILDKNKKPTSDPMKKINLFMAGLKELSSKASKESISIYFIGSTYRNNDIPHVAVTAQKQWFRPYPIGLKTLREEALNAQKLNKILANKIKDSAFTNVNFINPLEILDKSCGNDMHFYLECFRDSDHLSDKSAKELLDFILTNYLKP